MSNSVEVGAIGRLVPLFVQDATVSTGAGFPNLAISSFSSYYYRSDMTSTSSVTLVSTGTLGTWSSGQFLQINSSFMRGWYQFACPNGMFVAGSTVALHMYGHPSMAPMVRAIDVTRFNLQSATVDANRVGVSSFGLAVGVSSFGVAVGVSSFGITVGVSSVTDKAAYGVSSINTGVSTSWFSGGTIVTSAAGVLSVNVSSIQRDSAVTTAAGVLAVGAVGVSSFGLRVGVSSFGVPVGVSSFGITIGVSSNPIGVNLTSYRDTAAVTTFAGYPATYFDLALINNPNSTVALSSFSISSQSVTVGSVDVTSFYGSGLVTTAAGVLAVGRVGVSSFGLPVGVSSFGVTVGVSSIQVPVDVTSFFASRLVTSAAGVAGTHVTSMRIVVDEQIADSILARNIAGGSDGGRIVTEALYFLRNRSEISGTTLTVYQVDDTTSSWEATISTAVGNPIISVDPG